MNVSTKNAQLSGAAENDPRWASVVARDPEADGTFYYSVKTTGVDCRPSCAARLARPENVRFHTTPEDAEKAGFRPCKRCKSNQPTLVEQHAAKVTEACRFIEESENVPSLEELAKHVGLSIYHFHRVFKKVTGLTPRAYAAAHRAKRVRAELARRGTVTEAIYGAGYNNLNRDFEPAHTASSMESLELFEESLASGTPSASAEVAINRAYRRMVPRWHFAMLNDVDRNAAFRTALLAVVKSQDVVLEVGAGTGLLAMMAARARASLVVSCESVVPIAHVARRIVAANGLSDNVEIVAKSSFELRIGQDLPTRADVLVTETVDCGLLGEGILPIVRHAREHLLAKHARVIPAAARVYCSLLESAAIHRNNFAREAAGLDVSLFNRFSTREHFPVRLFTWDHKLLSAPAPFFDFDFQSGTLESRETEVHVAVDHSGWVHGIVFWFDLKLADDVRLSNPPGGARSHWMQAVHCFETPTHVERGTTVVVQAAHDEISFQFALQPQA
jgi:methylphosphotriester-DNA--protein-cysteine methyltransferase/predicted RNA methylase